MKVVHKLLALLLTVFIYGFASCTEDEDSWFGGGHRGEYLEVTVDGRTIRKVVEFTSVSASGGYSFVQTCDTYPIDLELAYHSNLRRVAKYSPGEYRFGYVYGVENFDLTIGYEYDDGYYGKYLYSEEGKHVVTSIKDYGDEVYVEGYFRGFLNDGTPISGRYRIALY